MLRPHVINSNFEINGLIDSNIKTHIQILTIHIIFKNHLVVGAVGNRIINYVVKVMLFNKPSSCKYKLLPLPC